MGLFIQPLFIMKFVTLDFIKKHPDTSPSMIEALVPYQYGVTGMGLVEFNDLDTWCTAMDWCVSAFGYDCSISLHSKNFLVFETESDQNYFLLKWS